jgi:hypothetical protein
VKEDGEERPGSKTAGADVVMVEEPTEEVYVGFYGGTSKKKLVKQ